MSTQQKQPFISRTLAKTKELGRFVTSRIFLKNFGLATVLFLAFLAILFLWLAVYTRHGDSVSVPDIKNMSLERAEEVLCNSSLQMFVVDSVYKTGVEGNLIVSQDPEPGRRVKEGRKIYLTVSAFNPPKKKLHYKMAGSDIKFVREQLKRLNMIVEERPISSGKDIGLVTRILIGDKVIFEKGKPSETQQYEVPEQTKIIVEYIFSAGIENPVPNVLGFSLDQAKFVFQTEGLNYNIINPDDAVDTTDVEAYVYKQIPMPDDGEVIRRGETILIYLTKTLPVQTPINNGGGGGLGLDNE